jgi:serine protease
MKHLIKRASYSWLTISLVTLLLLSLSNSALAARKFQDMTDQIIVKYNDDFISGEGIAKGLAKQINKNLRYVRQTTKGAHIYKLDARENINAVRGYVRAIQAIPGVAYAEPDQMMYKSLVEPNDPFYITHQWHYKNENIEQGGLNTPNAWSQFTGFEEAVYIAVLDTGITDHADLNANVVAGYDMISDSFISNDADGRDNNPSDPGDAVTSNECDYPHNPQSSSWHGTHVAGTIAAATNNKDVSDEHVGVAGVTYNLAKIVPVRVLGKCGGYTSDIADGIRWAAGLPVNGVTNDNENKHPAQVINMSLGGGGRCSSTYQNAINAAVLAGSTVVVSAGNSNTNARRSQPASCNNVITVAATGRTGGKAYYSNYGKVVDVAAPGGDTRNDSSNGILSTLNYGTNGPTSGNAYAWYQGTSMSAPHVAGVAALMYVKDGSSTPASIEATLKSTARPFPAACSSCGAGLVDAGAAVAASLPPAPNDPPTFTELSYEPIYITEKRVEANAGSFVVDINATDPEGVAVTYAIANGNTGGDFKIDVNTGIISVFNTLDYERTTSYTLTIEITDDLNDVQEDIDIYITNDPADDNDAPALTDADGDGHYAIPGGDDCDDNDSNTYPGHQDTRGKWGRNGVDNDCNGVEDG